LHACIIHASSRAVLDVIAISSHGPRQTPIASTARSRAPERKLHHNGIVLRIAMRQIKATRQEFAGCCFMRGRLFKFTYSSGASPWQHASQRAAFASFSKWRTASACSLPHSFDAASSEAHRSARSAPPGRARWSFVRKLALDLTLSALAAVALQKLPSRARPRMLSLREARDKLPQWL
jgi:hypothetical protein